MDIISDFQDNSILQNPALIQYFQESRKELAFLEKEIILANVQCVYKNLHVRSSLSWVLTGMSNCGLTAWQVKILLRSFLCILGMTRMLVVSLLITS